jgi:amino acid transporter
MVRQLVRGQNIAGSLATDRLGVAAVLFFVMAAAAPLTVVAGIVTIAYAVTGDVGLAAAFVVVGLVLLVFSVGYVTMSRHLPHAGAFYAYAGHGLGPAAGVGTAWVSLVAYNLLQTGLYGIIGSAVVPLLTDWFGISPPWWTVALIVWAFVAVLGAGRVDVNSGVLAGLLVCEIAVIGVFDGAFLLHPAHGLAWSTLSPTVLLRPGVGAILAIAVLGFVGFESAVVFTEESRHPARTIPRTTYLAVVVITMLYGVSAWAMAAATGTGQVVAAARAQGPGLLFSLASAQLGSGAATVGHVLFATSVLAAMISFHNTTARYGFALGREHVLPGRFGRTSTTGSPRVASIAQSVLGLTVIVVWAVGGWDPVLTLFYIAGAAGAFGILLLLVIAGLAVLGFFARDRRGESRWHTVIAPGVSLLGLGVVVTLVLANFATLLGVGESSPLRWGVPVGFATIGVVGYGYGLALRARRPAIYAAIGMGARAVLVSGVDHVPGGLTPKIPTPLPPATDGMDR